MIVQLTPFGAYSPLVDTSADSDYISEIVLRSVSEKVARPIQQQNVSARGDLVAISPGKYTIWAF